VEGRDWIIEGRGVEPDIYVDNDPAKEYAGIDQQLNKAIEVILEELKTKEKEIPPCPPTRSSDRQRRLKIETTCSYPWTCAERASCNFISAPSNIALVGCATYFCIPYRLTAN